MPVETGQQAPDFELRDQHNQPIRLSDYRGKKHVPVVFYPWAFSSRSDDELRVLRDDLAAFHHDEAALLAISCDAPPTHRRQAEEGGYAFPLLSDFWPHGEAAAAYGVFDERFGVARPATFLVDRGGILRYSRVRGIAEAHDLRALKDALTALA